MKRIIIAIDGYSSTGKSTFAKKIAAELGYIYIDTGALYRATTLQLLRKKVLRSDHTIDLAAMQQVLEHTRIGFQYNEGEHRSETFLDGENVEQQIRTLEVSNQVSYVAVIPKVRAFVDELLHQLGSRRGVVMDGRDIGSAVFPDAELKIFMTADPIIRAQRRLEEMRIKQPDITLEEVLQNIHERDHIDSSRPTNPLTKTPDALVLDNSNMTLDEQMDWFRSILPRYLHNESNH